LSSLLICFLLLLISLFAVLEVRRSLKNREFKEIIIASLFLLLGLSYGIDYAMDWKVLPNPSSVITIVKPVSQAFDRFFEVNK